MMTKIQGYDFKITYVPGPKLIISDTLSRMPNPNSGVHVSIDEQVDEITIDECEDISIDLLNFSPAKQAEIRHLTSTDPVMKTLEPKLTYRPRTFGCVAMGSALLFIVRSRLLIYSAGSGVNRVQVVLSGFSKRLFCFVQAKTLCRYGCMYFLAALVLVCVDVIVMSSA